MAQPKRLQGAHTQHIKKDLEDASQLPRDLVLVILEYYVELAFGFNGELVKVLAFCAPPQIVRFFRNYWYIMSFSGVSVYENETLLNKNLVPARYFAAPVGIVGFSPWDNGIVMIICRGNVLFLRICTDSSCSDDFSDLLIEGTRLQRDDGDTTPSAITNNWLFYGCRGDNRTPQVNVYDIELQQTLYKFEFPWQTYLFCDICIYEKRLYVLGSRSNVYMVDIPNAEQESLNTIRNTAFFHSSNQFGYYSSFVLGGSSLDDYCALISECGSDYCGRSQVAFVKSSVSTKKYFSLPDSKGHTIRSMAYGFDQFLLAIPSSKSVFIYK